MQFIDLKTRHRLIGDKINARIQNVMDHGQFILGPEVQEVEGKLAQYTGSQHCVTVSSGTDSLCIALMALGVGVGDEVVTVPYTWISTAEVIALLGAKPIIICFPSTFFLSANSGALMARVTVSMLKYNSCNLD